MRKWTGCGTTEDREAAERWWIRILRAVDDPECSVPRKVRVHAASCLAASQWEKRIVDDGDTWNVDCVSRAAFFANEAISYGFTSPLTLYVGAGIRRLLNTPRIPGVDYNRFDEFSFSFEAIAKRDEEVVEIASRREAKVSKAPNAYHCATPGCGIEATKKSGLLRCAGKCPAELKPSYCSKECQRAHWKDHRKVCNPDARAKEEQSRHPNHRPRTSNSPPTLSSENITDRRTKGKEHIIKWPAPALPGGKVKVTTNTCSPAFMKDVRDIATNEARTVVRRQAA